MKPALKVAAQLELLMTANLARLTKDMAEAKACVSTAIDGIADVVLAYRPKPKSKPAKKRQRVRRKLEKTGAP